MRLICPSTAILLDRGPFAVPNPNCGWTVRRQFLLSQTRRPECRVQPVPTPWQPRQFRRQSPPHRSFWAAWCHFEQELGGAWRLVDRVRFPTPTGLVLLIKPSFLHSHKSEQLSTRRNRIIGQMVAFDPDAGAGFFDRCHAIRVFRQAHPGTRLQKLSLFLK